MEDFTGLIVLGAIVVVVLQIIMIVKFFQMASDIRNLRNLEFEKFKEQHVPKWELNDSPFADVEMPDYSLNGDLVTFDDGKRGWIYQEFGTFSFIDNEEQQVFCYSRKEAIRGLYHTLRTKEGAEK